MAFKRWAGGAAIIKAIFRGRAERGKCGDNDRNSIEWWVGRACSSKGGYAEKMGREFFGGFFCEFFGGFFGEFVCEFFKY